MFKAVLKGIPLNADQGVITVFALPPAGPAKEHPYGFPAAGSQADVGAVSVRRDACAVQFVEGWSRLLVGGRME